jgi:uncharacterized protein YecE (DUF72 family)
MSDQFSLFESEAAPDPSVESVARVHAEARAIAADLTDDIRFGTSSWSFPGWKGIVYSGPVSAAAIARDGLRQYARHPLLRTVGIDRSYYAPIPMADLRRYAEQLPDGFKGCAKTPASVTSTVIGPPGSDTPNPHFLSVDRLIEEQLIPFAAAFRDHAGPFVIEFPPLPRRSQMEPADFLARVVPPEELPFAVVRLLLKPGTRYEDQRERFQPFDKLVAPDALMRQDVVDLSDRVLTSGRKLWVLVNNKAEGSSPLSIMELARRVAARRRRRDAGG